MQKVAAPHTALPPAPGCETAGRETLKAAFYANPTTCCPNARSAALTTVGTRRRPAPLLFFTRRQLPARQSTSTIRNRSVVRLSSAALVCFSGQNCGSSPARARTGGRPFFESHTPSGAGRQLWVGGRRYKTVANMIFFCYKETAWSYGRVALYRNEGVAPVANRQ